MTLKPDELVARLRTKAREEEAAYKMLADAKTARQTDRDDAWTDAGYSWVRAEQTICWQAADRIEELESRTLPLDGDVVERVRDSLGKTEAALDNGLTPHELDELTTAAITAIQAEASNG